MRRKLVSGLVVAILVAACSGNPYYDPAKPHHTSNGFKNNYPHPQRPGFLQFLKWRWRVYRDKLPPEPEDGYSADTVAVDLGALINRRHNPSLTWIGHASFLLQLGGANILTDPHLTERASPVEWAGPVRRVPPALDFDDLPTIDFVVISHNHYDHLDRETVLRLSQQPGSPPRFFVPLGLARWFREQGIDNVTELDWWDREAVGSLQIHFVPAQHWSNRTEFDKNRSLWGGWIIAHPDFRFYFAGDTGYSQDFTDIGARFPGIDLAALPIGSYEPRWFMKMQHVDPNEAVQIHKDLGTRYSVAMHWGTFELTDEPLDEPPRALARALESADVSPQRFFMMKHGQTLNLDSLTAAESGLAFSGQPGLP